MELVLVMFKADGQRRDFPVQKPTITLGRSRECDLQIPLGIVSRKHCEIGVEGNQVIVRDLMSANGTLVNNRRIEEQPVSAGDTITIGPVVFTAMIDGQPAQIKPVRTLLVETRKSSADSSVITNISDESHAEFSAPESAMGLRALEDMGRKEKE